jgi:hypothetical protein
VVPPAAEPPDPPVPVPEPGEEQAVNNINAANQRVFRMAGTLSWRRPNSPQSLFF